MKFSDRIITAIRHFLQKYWLIIVAVAVIWIGIILLNNFKNKIVMAHVTLRNELQQIKQLLLLNNKTVLTPDEVSLMYGLSKDYLYHLTSERVIPFHKPNGKKIFFDKEEVENWLLQNRQDTVEETQQKATLYNLKNKGGVR